MLRSTLFLLALTAVLGCRKKNDPADAAPADAEVVDAHRGEDAPGTDASTPADASVDTGTDGGPAGDLVPDLRMSAVAVFQSVRVLLYQDGVEVPPASRNAPVVAGREAIFRIYPAAEPGWSSRPVRGVVEIGGRRFVSEGLPSLPAEDEDPTSVLDVRVPAEAITADATFRVRLEEIDRPGVSEGFAMWPALETPLGAQEVPTPTLVLVPFRYDTDGSGRLPATDEAQLALYREELTTRYPYAEVAIRVHAPVPWSRSLRFNRNVDWGDVNAALIDLRDDEGAPPHEYWYGVMAPHESRASYCASTFGSCVTGQSYVATVDGTRVGSGVGFAGRAQADTLAHETGHLHGRYHAPCGAGGPDRSYPYGDGSIGVWGWSRVTGEFFSPRTTTDLMGYCSPQWVSDYTYQAFFDRAVAVRALYPVRASDERPVRLLRVRPDGSTESRVLALHHVPGATDLRARWYAGTRRLGRVDAGLLRDCQGERHYFLPDEPAGATHVELEGQRHRL